MPTLPADRKRLPEIVPFSIIGRMQWIDGFARRLRTDTIWCSSTTVFRARLNLMLTGNPRQARKSFEASRSADKAQVDHWTGSCGLWRKWNRCAYPSLPSPTPAPAMSEGTRGCDQCTASSSILSHSSWGPFFVNSVEGTSKPLPDARVINVNYLSVAVLESINAIADSAEEGLFS